jgi:hypothetical protein
VAEAFLHVAGARISEECRKRFGSFITELLRMRVSYWCCSRDTGWEELEEAGESGPSMWGIGRYHKLIVR